MNGKQFIALLVLVAVLGGGAWLYSRKQTAGWGGQSPEVGQKLLGNFQVNDVAQIRIEQGTNDLTLLQTNGLWRVVQRGDYPANFSQISQLLLKLRDLKIVQTEEVGELQMPELGLGPPGQETNAATELAFFDSGGRPIRVLWLGKPHLQQSSQGSPGAADESWPNGRFVVTASNATTVAVISDPLDEVTPSVAGWLDKTFFSVQKPESVSVDYPVATNSWTLTRSSETNQWKLADARPGEKLDESQATETANSCSSPSFQDVVTGLDSEQTGLDKPTRVRIKTFDGFDYAVNVGRETNDNYFVTVNTSVVLPKEPSPAAGEKPEQRAAADKAFQTNLKTLEDKLGRERGYDKWIYLVPTWSLNSLLKTREQLLVQKPSTTDTNAPAAAGPLIQ